MSQFKHSTQALYSSTLLKYSTQVLDRIPPPPSIKMPSIHTSDAVKSRKVTNSKMLQQAPECMVDTSLSMSVVGIEVTPNPFQVLATNNNRSRAEQERANRIAMSIGSRHNMTDHHKFDRQGLLNVRILNGRHVTYLDGADYWSTRQQIQHKTVLRKVNEPQESPFKHLRA